MSNMNKKTRRKNSFILKALPPLFGVLQVLSLHLDGSSVVPSKWNTTSNQMLNNWYDRCCDGVSENVDCPGLVLTEDGVNRCELFWHLDPARRAKLWGGMNEKERREIVQQLNLSELGQLIRILNHDDQGALFDSYGNLENKFDDFDDLSEVERVCCFMGSNNEDRFVLLTSLMELDDGVKQLVRFVCCDVGEREPTPLIRILNEEQCLWVVEIVSKSDHNSVWRVWSMLSDIERQQVIASLHFPQIAFLFVDLMVAENRNGNEEIHRQIAGFLREEQLVELFLSMLLSGSFDGGRVLLWRCFDSKIRRIVWDIMNIAAETGKKNSEQLSSYLEKVNLPMSVVSPCEFDANNRARFLFFLDSVGFKLLKDILKTEELIQLWLESGDVTCALLWYNLTNEERAQLRQNPDIQKKGPSFISEEGGLAQWYRFMKIDRWKVDLCCKLDEKGVTRLWNGLDSKEHAELGLLLSFYTICSGQFSLLGQLWVDKMNDSERTSIWSDMKTDHRAALWKAILQKNREDALLCLRQDEYEMVNCLEDIMGIRSRTQPALLLKDWRCLSPKRRANSFWLLWPNEREEAWNMLEPWTWKYCYKHLSTPLKAKYWNSLDHKAKMYNIWCLSEEQRAKLYITSADGTRSPAFLPNEISMDRKRFAQLSVQEQDDFCARVTASVYIE